MHKIALQMIVVNLLTVHTRLSAMDAEMHRVTPHDAARYWNRFEADTYDCILLDAPCTSERHVVQQAASDAGRGSKSRWSLHQCHEMAALQVKLLTAALKVGYTSCPVCRLVHACR